MYCRNCYKQVNDNSEICEHCGYEIGKKNYTIPKTILEKAIEFTKNKPKKAIVIMIAVGVILLMVFGVVIPRIKPYSIKSNKYVYEYCGTHIRLAKYLGTEEIVKIPAFVGWLPVSEIGKECFLENEIVQEVIISDTVRIIGEKAFCGCDNLQKVKFPSGLKEIKRSAFRYSSLAELEIPNRVEEIGEGAFSNTKIKNVTIPESVKVISIDAFGYCSLLEDVTISENVEEVWECSFEETPWLDNQKEEFVIVGNKVLIKYNGQDSTICVPEGVTFIDFSVFNIRERGSIDVIVLPTSLEKAKIYAGELKLVGYTVFQSDLDKKDLERLIRLSGNGAHLVAPKDSTVYRTLIREGVECMTLEEYEKTYGLP